MRSLSKLYWISKRGREVKEFIEDDLGPEGLARSVVVAASSDETGHLCAARPPMSR